VGVAGVVAPVRRRATSSLPGDTLVCDEIDGASRVQPFGALNRGERRHLLFVYRPRNPRRAWREAVERLARQRASRG